MGFMTGVVVGSLLSQQGQDPTQQQQLIYEPEKGDQVVLCRLYDTNSCRRDRPIAIDEEWSVMRVPFNRYICNALRERGLVCPDFYIYRQSVVFDRGVAISIVFEMRKLPDG